eukprot:SAG22_NODE_2001_length_3168_cov_24.284132_4_plen_126_part_00
MEFHSRKACLDYYTDQYPHLPKYMVEMAMDYDLEQSNKKMTGAERRKLKHVKPVQRESRLTEITPGVTYGTAKVVSPDEYVMAPMIKGAIEIDGAKINSEDFVENKIFIDTNGRIEELEPTVQNE